MKRFLLILVFVAINALLALIPTRVNAQFIVCYNTLSGTGTTADPYVVAVTDGAYPNIILNAYPAAESCASPVSAPLSTLIWNAIVVDAGTVVDAANPNPTVSQTSPAGISRIISFSGALREKPYKFSITVTESGGLNPQTITFILVYTTSKLSDISLVLDISGSMGSTAELGQPETRLQVLQKAVNDFTDIYNTFSIAVNQGQTDKLGVVYFTTSVIPSVAAGTPMLLDGQPSTVAALKTEVLATTPQQSTAMGLGLNEGYSQLGLTGAHITDPLDPNYRTKNIVLFTDGIQNVVPLVDDPGATPNTLTIAGGSNLVSDGLLKVSVVALIQTTTTYNMLLSRIATSAGGKFFTVTRNSDVNEFFKYGLTSALKNRSPQVVEFRYSTLVSGQGDQKFEINSGVKKVVLELWSNDSTATFSVQKDGVDVTNSVKFIKGNGYLLGVVTLPAKGNPSLVSKGDWIMKIKGNGNDRYRAYAMVDDHALKYATSIRTNRKINKPLDLAVKLDLNGKHFSTATVKALVLKPGQDLGTLLATTPAPRKNDNHQVPADLSPGNAKLQELLKDSSFYNALLPKEQIVTLTVQSDSTYAGTFANTDVTGAYQVIYKIEGQTPQAGKFVRTDMETTVLELDEIDLDQSTASSTHLKDTLKITIRPRSSSGLYLGPDYTTAIKLTSSIGKVVKTIDHVDGSYTIVVANVPENVNPEITLTILDQKIYEGKSGCFGEPWYVCYWWIWILLILLIIIIIFLIRRSKK
jgi:hypothetical protein